MILFADDWAKYPNPCVHVETKNESFRKIAAVYKKMGVKNHAFPLALIQPELRHVDPFDPNLDRDICLKIVNECKSNPWYYFREIANFTGSGGIRIPFEATRANISMLWCFFNHIDYYLIQPRQTFKTGSFSCLYNYLMCIACYKTDLSFFTQDRGRLIGSIRELKELRSNLPEYVYFPNKDDADNMHSLTVKLRKNTLSCRVGQKDKENAEKAGRGSTSPIWGADEFAYMDGNEIIVPSALPGVTQAREHAKASGIPYGILFMTTAGNLAQKRGRYAHKIMLDGTVFNERFYDAKNEEQLRALVGKNAGRNGTIMCVGVWNHRQLGRSDRWLKERMDLTRSEGGDAEKDFLNVWVTGGEQSPLLEGEIKALQSGIRDPEYVEITQEGYCLNWYVTREEITERMSKGHYVIGLDTSEAAGGSGDAIALVMIDIRTHEVVCTGRYKQTSIPVFAEFLARLLIKYPNTTLIYERRSTAKAMMDTLGVRLLINNVNPFRRVYNRIASEPKQFEKLYNHLSGLEADDVASILEQNARSFGFATSGSGVHARGTLYGVTLRDMLGRAGHLLYDRTLCQELLGLRIKNNRVDHGDGEDDHDDMVIASLLAHWFCASTTNLQFYGIDSRNVFSSIQADRDIPIDEQIELDINEEIRDAFNEAYMEMKETDDPNRYRYLENYLRMLSRDYNVEEITGNNLDQLLTELQANRDKNQHFHTYQRMKGARNSPRNNPLNRLF